MIRDVLVLGGGSAGFLAAMTLKRRLPELAVTVVRSRDLGVIGVGESTTVAVPRHLHGYLDFDPAEFHRRAQPSWKLGIRFLWGPRPFFDYTFGLQLDWKWANLSRNNGYYCEDDFTYVDLASALMSHKKAFVRQPNGDPLIGRDFGYHIDNARFVAYLEDKAAGMGVVALDDVITDVQPGEAGVTAVRLASGATLSADLYIDCTGFRALLLGKALGEPFVSYKTTLFCDCAVASSWPRADEVINPYTTAETMDAGWCWQIDHPDSIMRGYVYSSAFLSDDEAEREFRAKSPRAAATRVIPFVSGRYERSWAKNVVAVGNAAGFVEPLESTSLAIICDESRLLAECLGECDRRPTPSLVDSYNRINVRAWDTIRDFLGIHYKFNTRLDTPFWRACRADVELGPIQELVDYYRENGPSTFARTTLLHGNDIFGMEGYLALLVGQRVPYRRRHVPSPEELRVWHGVRAENRMKALTALSVREALAAVTAPNWQWVPGYFRSHSSPQPTASQLTSFIGAAG
ncbi:MAG TPA: tryptophan halogenase family protein [Gemmataceae bacterium]|nr:tryptophan halogenase family protein [Gemmataceae bacterium]